jgi:PAS domain S-box-containing protein
LQGIALLKGNPPVLVYVNPKWVEIFGYSPDEALSMGPREIWKMVHPDDRKMVRQRNGDRLAGKPVVPIYEFRIIRKDGSTRWVQVYANKIADGEEGPSSQAVYVDITEQKHAEEALALERTFIDAIFNSIPGMLYLYDAEGNLVRWNKKHETMTGYSAEELSKMHLMDWYKEDTESQKAVTEGLKRTMEKGFGDAEANLQKKDGTILPSYFTACPLTINGKQYFTGIGIDITERKRAEEEKLETHKIGAEQEKHALVGQIAGKMAHDFNNVLGIIMGNTELSLLDCKDAETRKTLELIYEQTQRGKNLTKNLVAFAKDQEPKQEFFRLTEKIDLVINLLKKDLEGIELIKENATGLPDLLADPGMIEHALVNLIQNSIHALSMVEYPRIIIRTHSNDNQICFEIEDNGCGISKEHLESIYEPSFTLKGSRDLTGSYKTGIKGTGYGMSNVKKYIEQHKGVISVESELGSVTRFTIRLPIIKKELTTKEKTKIRTGKIHFQKYILLVEDEQAISDIQYRVLTQEPCRHKVDIANSGKIAMDLFERNKYDLISLDYILPGNINGMDIYHHVRAKDKTIPILFISGNIEFLESLKKLKQKDPYIDHLSKPCKSIDYINCINHLFGNLPI